VAAVLHQLKKKGVSFIWRADHQTAFILLKQALCEAPVLQIPDFSKEFILVTDASDRAVSAVLHQRVSEVLAPISFHSRLLTDAEKRYNTYEKECLAALFGCKKCRTYLDHKEFELRCDNLALCWLLKRVKDVGRLGRWILRLAPLKFKVVHTRGVDNAVADALSLMFEREVAENPEFSCAVLRASLPLVYSSLKEHQEGEVFCKELWGKVQQAQGGSDNFNIQKGLLCYFPRKAKRCGVKTDASEILSRRYLVGSSGGPQNF
jgi:phospholipid-translocating ATPase